MKQKRTYITLLLVVALLCLGIAYAAISNITLQITGSAAATPNQDNFIVKFDKDTVVTTDVGTTGATVTADYVADDANDLTATIDVSGLTAEGQKVSATYTIENESIGLSADLAASTIKNSNTEYFKVTPTLAKSQILEGETTTVTVEVEMVKTPITTDVSTEIEVNVVASPVDPNPVVTP